MEELVNQFRTLLSETDTTFLRYIHDEIDWDARMVAVVGARGVGKTTLLLQHIKLHNDVSTALFVSADNIYFVGHTLYETAERFYNSGGKYFYIDEVHKYENWSRELKMIYDLLPNIQIVFTGSSVLDIYKGSADLSRRVLTYELFGMSFREYIAIKYGIKAPVYTLEDILAHKVSLPDVEHPLALFQEYLREGYYPYFGQRGYEKLLRQSVELTLETDIPSYASMTMTTVRKLKQLLYIISQSVPFKPNFTKIATLMDVHRNQVTDYMYYLEKAGVIMQLRGSTKGIRALGKIEKVYLNNTNLMYIFSPELSNIGNIRETFFFSQTRVRHDVSASVLSDFEVDGITFEIGGKNKGQKQIERLQNAYVVKDDIVYGHDNVIPLWHFGLMY